MGFLLNAKGPVVTSVVDSVKGMMLVPAFANRRDPHAASPAPLRAADVRDDNGLHGQEDPLHERHDRAHAEDQAKGPTDVA